MSEDRVTLITTLITNNDPCVGYYLSFNYSTPSDVPQHIAVPIHQIAVSEDDEVIIDAISQDDGSIVRRRFSGEYTALEDPCDLGGVWFRAEHANYGIHGLWVCISPRPQTMGLLIQ
jgi:hypothetical protein